MAENTSTPEPAKRKTATQFFLKGLAISLPPILTLVILLWMGRGINDYIISPISGVVRFGLAKLGDHSVSTDNLYILRNSPPLPYCDKNYRLTADERDRLQGLLKLTMADALTPKDIVLDYVYVPMGDKKRSVPYRDYVLAAEHVRPSEMPTTVTGLYMDVAMLRQPFGLLGLSAVAVSIAILILYYLGRIGTAHVGAWGVQKFETLFMGKLPVISNVYSSVKQVTDFLFNERTVQYNRVVVVEYPRRGIWSMGFVTGESLLEVTAAAGEPLVSVLIPTSPMPVTGYTINVPRSEVLDLDMTIDQAFQFCLSCGVHVPIQQRVTPELLQQELTRRLTGADRSRRDRAVERPDQPTSIHGTDRRPEQDGPKADRPHMPS